MIGALWQAMLVWKLVIPYDARLFSVLIVFAWGMLPYGGLAASTVVIRRKSVLIAVGAVQCWLHFRVGIDALHPHRSTAALGLGLEPLFALIVLIPAAVLLDRILNGREHAKK